MNRIAKQIGLNINTNKTKIMKINARSIEPVTLNADKIEEVSAFVYPGSKLTADVKDVKARISKSRGAFAILNTCNIWKS